MADLGYTSYDYYAEVKEADAHLVVRLKDNANPTIVAVRHGVWAPVRTVKEGLGLNDPDLELKTKCETFDLDARFKTKEGSVVLRVVGLYNPETEKYHCYATTLPAEQFTASEIAGLYSFRWIIELLFKLLKSGCHLDHVETANADALRTHIYASLLAAALLSALCSTAAAVAGLLLNDISGLTAAIAAPLIMVPLLLLWLERELTPEALSDCILRVLAVGCRDQNPKRTRRQWGVFR